MPDIFFSYAHEDLERIRPIVSALESQGLTVFWDRRIPAGQTWRSYIGKALDEGKCMIVAWSRDSINSDWVLEEADEGKRRGKLVPVLLDQVEPPRGFREIQAANLSDWQAGQSSEQFKLFLQDVRSVLGAQPLSDKPEPQYHEKITQNEPKGRNRVLFFGVASIIIFFFIGAGIFLYRNRLVPKPPSPGVVKVQPERPSPAGLRPPTVPESKPDRPEKPSNLSSSREIPSIPPIHSKQLAFYQGPYHIGDEDIEGWPPLHGDCFEFRFHVDQPEKELVLRLRIYGVEKSIIFLNGHTIDSLRQDPRPGEIRPNYWEEKFITLDEKYLIKGYNILKICAQEVPNWQFKGDKDDFQIKDIKIITK